ncbi:hypothetical protein BH18ACI5_BH18ACI5_09010 [soil metagenome]
MNLRRLFARTAIAVLAGTAIAVLAGTGLGSAPVLTPAPALDLETLPLTLTWWEG